MHEKSLAMEIRSVCERELANLPGKHLRGIGIDLGVFSGVEADTLQFCLEVVMADGFDDVRFEIDPSATLRALWCEHRCGYPVSRIAAAFHNTVADFTRVVCRAVRERTGLTASR